MTKRSTPSYLPLARILPAFEDSDLAVRVMDESEGESAFHSSLSQRKTEGEREVLQQTSERESLRLRADSEKF